MKNNTAEYKLRIIRTWNEVAPRYHKRWARRCVGPFESTAEIIKLSKISKNDAVLDLACGTGVVTKKLSNLVGSKGQVIGIDSSFGAIKIARSWCGRKNAEFIISDALSVPLVGKFNAVTCQFAIFFFPDSQNVLRKIKTVLKKGGILSLSVHGKRNKVPFFSSILDPVTEFIPDYLPDNAPTFDRFSTKTALRDEVKNAGYSRISVKKYTFQYSPGSFDDYWINYLNYIPKQLKEKIDSLSKEKRNLLLDEIKVKTLPFTKKNGKIVFPWEVLILTAQNN